MFSEIKDKELADIMLSCYNAWKRKYHPLFVEEESDVD